MALPNVDNLIHLGMAPALATEVANQVAPLMATTAITALNTVGAGTITAAGIAGGVTARGGAQSATPFTDTTATAALIIAAMPNAAIGQSFYYLYQNNTNAAATLSGGTGVTVSGITVVPQNSYVEYIATYTAANTITIAAVSAGSMVPLPAAQFKTHAASNGTLAAGIASGAAVCIANTTAAGANAVTLRTATQMFADIPGCQIGFSYILEIFNTGNNTVTVTAPDANTTITGTATVATVTSRRYFVTFTAATTMTLQNIGGGIAN